MKKVLSLSFIALLALNGQVETAEATGQELTQSKYSLTDTITETLVEDLLEDFSNEKGLTLVELDENTINEFVDYTVDSGAIENTIEARGEVAVTAVRLQFKAVVAGGNVAGYTMAAELLNHSLQDSPVAKNYASGTAISNQVKNSAEVNNIVASIKKSVSGKKLSSHGTSGSDTLDSTKDLFLGLNKVSYNAKSTKNLNTGLWTTTITFNDTYDFDPLAWQGVSAGLGHAAVVALNNYAVDAERIGAIVPYKITIKTTHTFYE